MGVGSDLNHNLIYHGSRLESRVQREKKLGRPCLTSFLSYCIIVFLFLKFPSPSKGAVDLVEVTGVSRIERTSNRGWLLPLQQNPDRELQKLPRDPPLRGHLLWALSRLLPASRDVRRPCHFCLLSPAQHGWKLREKLSEGREIWRINDFEQLYLPF